MGPLAMAGIAAGAAAAKTGLQAIPTKFERDQKKRLKELQRKQEMGLLGLTEAERSQIESQLRGSREQAQRRSDAEIARLSTPTAQSGQQLLAAQLGAEGRQRMEADLASQLLGMDIQRQREQEADIAALEAGRGLQQAELRSNLASIPMAGLEAYTGQMALDQMLNAPQATTPQATATQSQVRDKVLRMNPLQLGQYFRNLGLQGAESELLKLEGQDLDVDMSTLPSNQEAARFMAERRGNLQAAQGASAYNAMPTYQQQVDGLFPQGGTMPQLQSPQRQVDGLFPQGRTMPQLQSSEPQIEQSRIEATPIPYELPISQDAIEIMARHNINRRELEEAYRIMNMLNERSALNVTIDEAVRIYKNMPMYNQNLNIPSDQVSMINATAFPALSGRMNVTDTRGREI